MRGNEVDEELHSVYQRVAFLKRREKVLSQRRKVLGNEEHWIVSSVGLV